MICFAGAIDSFMSVAQDKLSEETVSTTLQRTADEVLTKYLAGLSERQ